VKKVDSLCVPLIRELGLQEGVKLAAIKKDWFNLFDKPLCYHMSPCSLSHSEILLNVDSPVWLQELQYYKKDILKKMSLYGVKSIQLKIGRVSNKRTTKNKSRESKDKTLTTEEISFMDTTVSQINDEELKKAVFRAMKKSLSTSKIKE
jgi:hypothetical protein